MTRPSIDAGTAAAVDSTNSHRGCPCCLQTDLRRFYSVENIPAHSCLLMDTPDEALTYPRGNLTLEYCSRCGFITNSAYDESLKDYSQKYEETQHFSETFNKFAHGLAQRWVDQYDLHNKTVLEIGCGKGEFLELLCRLGDNQGIGFDPGVHPERLSDEANSRIRFVKDYYSETSYEPADAICCRHTLEHIAQPHELISAIRKNIGDEEVLLLFELPDTTRVLRECAFWDLYYEHCSYFTATSLAELFRRNRFELLELERDFDDQYLLLVARPSPSPTEVSLPLEGDLAGTIKDLEDFQSRQQAVRQQWRERVEGFAAAGQRTILWGGGSKAVSFLTTLGLGAEIDYVVDINPNKHDKYIPGSGHRVVSPSHTAAEPPNNVIVMNPVYTTEIGEMLGTYGLSPTLLPLGE